MGCFPTLSRRWRVPKVMYCLMAVELLGTIACLAFFGLAEPNEYRTKMWQVGYENGFNSSPNQILYAYANYRPIPKTPLVWSATITQFNVAISVLSTFVLLCKAVLFVLRIWYPLLGILSNIALTALYLTSVYGQSGPDYSDARYPSKSAWYITKSCDYAKERGWEGFCMQAKGSFAATVIMAALFFANLCLAIWSAIPTAGQRALEKLEFDDMQVTKDSPSSPGDDRQWEMKTVPMARATPVTPYTPRTLAFNTLDRQLPLRAQEQARWA